jgi:hypothetical protein
MVVRFALPAQPVDATQALNLSAGVSNCKMNQWNAVVLRKPCAHLAVESRRPQQQVTSRSAGVVGTSPHQAPAGGPTCFWNSHGQSAFDEVGRECT